MPLKFPGAWRFKPPVDGRFVNHTVPPAVVEDCIALIKKVATQGDYQEVLEHFKGYFCGACGSSHSWSSDAGWAETDLWTYARKAAANAPLFIEAFYDACQSFAKDDDWAPDAEIINEVLTRHNVGYLIKPPRLEPRENAPPVVAVVAAPPYVLAAPRRHNV